jgi:hypothetical protein
MASRHQRTPQTMCRMRHRFVSVDFHLVASVVWSVEVGRVVESYAPSIVVDDFAASPPPLDVVDPPAACVRGRIARESTNPPSHHRARYSHGASAWRDHPTRRSKPKRAHHWMHLHMRRRRRPRSGWAGPPLASLARHPAVRNHSYAYSHDRACAGDRVEAVMDSEWVAHPPSIEKLSTVSWTGGAR